MKNLNLDEFFRYLAIGIFTTTLLVLKYPEPVKPLLTTLTGLGVLILVLGIGALIYQLYHPIFYKYPFIMLKDHLFKKNNIRSYIMEKYGFSRWDAENFYYLIRETCFDDHTRTITHFHGAGIHFLYMCSVVLLSGSILFRSEIWQLVICLSGALVTYFAALTSDLTLEKKEWALFKEQEYKNTTGGMFKELEKHYRSACDLPEESP